MEEETSLDAFLEFARDGTLNGQAVRVIPDDSVQVVDEAGNVSAVGARLHFLSSEIPAWTEGDELTLGAKTYRMGEVAADDGYVVEILAYPVSP